MTDNCFRVTQMAWAYIKMTPVNMCLKFKLYDEFFGVAALPN